MMRGGCIWLFVLGTGKSVQCLQSPAGQCSSRWQGSSETLHKQAAQLLRILCLLECWASNCMPADVNQQHGCDVCVRRPAVQAARPNECTQCAMLTAMPRGLAR